MTDVSVLQATDLVREYEGGGGTVRALKGVDVSVDPGEFVAILGPSGSGKSTLLNVLGLLDTPTAGTVEFRDRTAGDLSARQRTRLRRNAIGFVFQNFQLIPTLTARENVEVPGWLENSPRATADRAGTLLERVGLGDRLEHAPDELSGGQKQRVAIARSLINEPDLVLADEPTGNLDRETGGQIFAEFERITDEEDVAVVTVTHDEIVAEYVDRTIELVDGRIESRTGRGTPSEDGPDAEAGSPDDSPGSAGSAPDRVGTEPSGTETESDADPETATGIGGEDP